MELLREYWPIVAFVFGLALTAGGWAIRKGLASREDLAGEAKARAEAIGALEGRIATSLDSVRLGQIGLSNRTLQIETEIKHLPTAADVRELTTAIAGMSARMQGMSEKIHGMELGIDRIEDHLLKRQP